jgi:hypothetical protein
MADAGGFGGAPWGGSWGGAPSGGTGGGGGGAKEPIPKTQLWDVFDLSRVTEQGDFSDMERVTDFAEVVTEGQPDQFFVGSFVLASGAAFPTDPAVLNIIVPVQDTFTMEWRVRADALPPDFNSLTTEHVYLSVTDLSGPCLGLLLSQAGIQYTGSAHFVGKTLQLDHPVTALPGSSDWVAEGQDTTIRVIADTENGLVYLYVTPTAALAHGGHVLRALLPLLIAADSAFSVIDRALVSVRGTALHPSKLALEYYRLSSRLLIPNLPPKALVGEDQTARICSIIRLDGTESFDPENFPLSYEWRLIDAPDSSRFVYIGSDGFTVPEPNPVGFTAKFFSASLGVADGLEPIVPGDVVVIGGVARTVVGKSSSPSFHVVIDDDVLPDNLASNFFKLIRQTAVTDRQTARPSFFPDKSGLWLFDLRVHDGSLWSSIRSEDRTTSLVNVLESSLPKGCVPDVRFIFDYLPDFWHLVEDGERLSVFWGALAQVAATELLTLWQHHYAKSHRDIQKTFLRRWLHYDLLLGEPVPELTRTKIVWSGVYGYSAAATVSLNGTRLALTSPAFSDAVLDFQTTDPLPVTSIPTGLQQQLQLIAHPSFRVSLVEQRDGAFLVMMVADVPFTVRGDTTAALWSPGAFNSPRLELGNGVKINARTYACDYPLRHLDLSDAFLCIDGAAYRIERVVDDPGDLNPFSRVVLKDELPASVGFQSVISGWVSSEFLDFYRGLVSRYDAVDFEVLEQDASKAPSALDAQLVPTFALGACEAAPGKLPFDPTALSLFLGNPKYSIRLARVTRRTFLPVDKTVVDIPYLQPELVPTSDATVLRRNLDYYIEQYRGQYALRFRSGADGWDVWEGENPPPRLWAEYTYFDNSAAIEENFGLAVGLTREDLEELPDRTDYLSAVRGLAYAFVNGPTLYNSRVGVQILLGLPYAEEAGTIEEIRKDLLATQGRILVRDAENTEIVRAYSFPKALLLEVNPATGRRYEVGDTVTQFAPLVEGAEVVDYVKDPNWFRGILNQGVFHEVEKYHRFLVRVDSRAFSLGTLLLARKFILKIKPTYTHPLFVVQFRASDLDGDEISVNDTIRYHGRLQVEDSLLSGLFGAATMFDEPRPAGGGWRSQFDADSDPNTPPPVFPVGEETLWGFDKESLSPRDTLEAQVQLVESVDFTPTFDTIFKFDAAPQEAHEFGISGPFTVQASPTGLTLSFSDPSWDLTSVISLVSLRFLGETGLAHPDWVFQILKNGVDATGGVVTFSTDTCSEVSFAPNLSVTAGDVVAVRILSQSGNACAPTWSKIVGRAFASASSWSFDMGAVGGPPLYASGTYEAVKVLVP